MQATQINTSKFRNFRNFKLSPWIILLGILIALVIMVWGTLGLRTPAIYEDWVFYKSFSKGLSPLDFSVFTQPSRPFLEIASWFGYLLTPNSFVGLNIINLCLFIIQGIVVFVLIRQLQPDRSWFAIAVAILSLILPADTTLADNRMASYHIAVIAFLLSVCFLISY